MIDLTTPVGRLVGGHPMVMRPNKDEKTGLPKMQKDNVTPSMSVYIGLAIPKGAEQHWNQTEWGAKIHAEALASFPNGEYQMDAFSWKIIDGDSQVPNKKMKKPCDREGYPGHWVIQASSSLGLPKCYNVGKYNPLTDQIQQKEMIKPGDYARLVLSIKGNGAVHPNTPGVYMNPTIFELYQPGQQIILESEPDAQAALGTVQGQLPQGALVDTNVPALVNTAAAPAQANAPAPANVPATPGSAPAAPATDILTPVEVKYQTADGQWSEAQLLTAGYQPAQIAALPKVP